jgi:hypothetical protein
MFQKHDLFANRVQVPLDSALNTFSQIVPSFGGVHNVSGCSQFADLCRVPWSETKTNVWLHSGAANFVVSQVGSAYAVRVGLMHTGPNTVSADLASIFWAFAPMIDQSSAFARLLYWSLQEATSVFRGKKHAVPHEVHHKEREHGSRLPAVPGFLFGVDTPIYSKMLCLGNIGAVRALSTQYEGLVPPIMMNIEIHHRANCSLGSYLSKYPAEISYLDLAVFAFGYVHDQALMTESSNVTFTDAHEGNLLVNRTEDGRLLPIWADAGQTSNATREVSQFNRVVERYRNTLLQGWERVPEHDATYRALSHSNRIVVDRYMPQVIGSLRARRDDETSVLQYLQNMQVDINNAITAMIAAADLRDEFDRRLGASSLLSLHVRTIRQGQDIIALQSANKTTNSKLVATQMELKETQAQLNETKVELMVTNSRLSATQAQLNETQVELKETQVELKETQVELKETQVELRVTKVDGIAANSKLQAELNETKANLNAKVDQLSQAFEYLKQQLQDSKTQSRSESRDES